ncbi:hypothetical protein V1525DRAFT_369840 [Lipomyces kononenkoae]|uniref:Uncharacterized protein n=1 Tax=Lipomyces kononenkoae TaxID=34357 RepID=A0ACC3TAL5_LIPKO
MNILQRSSSSLSLFDIRLYSADHDVIVVRGTPDESAGVLLKGAVVLSLIESVSVKRISLRLYGTIRMNWQETVQSARGLSQRTNRYEKVIYEHTWNFLDWDGNRSTSHTVGQGNYEYPFELILPGSMAESVEGLEGGSVIYKMKAIVERGRFTNNLIKKKHIRVVRTLGPEALELSQTMSIENVWPNKVDYAISIPSKAVPIGSSTPVHLLLQPLLKGLKLGQIVIVLKEYYTLHIPNGPGHASVRTVSQVTLPAPEVNEDEIPGDVWDIRDFFPVPPNLTKCTQDCDIPGFIEVRHKLKFAVSLKNPDGHVSELRASLPISLFISPNVPVNDGGEEIRLKPLNDDNETTAPPRYDDHIYDRLWEDISLSGSNTPINTSGTNTPHIRSRRNSGENSEALGFTPMDHDRAQLQAGLSALAMSQASSQSDSYFPSRHSGSVTPLGVVTPLTNIHDDGTVGFVGLDQATNWHVSRGPSPVGSPVTGTATPAESDDGRLELDLSTLTKVPSYTTAIKTPITEDLPVGPPLYDDEEFRSPLGPRSARSSGPPSRAASPQPASNIIRSASAVQLSSTGRSRAHFLDDAARRLRLLQERTK